MGQDRPETTSAMRLLRSGEIPILGGHDRQDKRLRHYTLVRGSDPPLSHSACMTAGEMWRAPARRRTTKCMAAGVKKAGDQKLSIPLRWRKIDNFLV